MCDRESVEITFPGLQVDKDKSVWTGNGVESYSF